MTSGFEFSERSLEKLEGVHPDLVKVVHKALEISEIDFGITEGVRTESRQKALVKAGKSKTLKSKHLKGHAVDIVCYVDGEVSWKFVYYRKVAEAFRKASILLNIPVKWGGCWLGPLSEFRSAASATEKYVTTRRSEGARPFIDGPHFELHLPRTILDVQGTS